jgi:hypothetical protein
MKSMTFEIPVGDKPYKKKRWWEFWRKKGDSAEEAIADIISRYKEDIDWKHLDRSAKIGRMLPTAKLPTAIAINAQPVYQYQKEYWFSSPVVDNSILRMTRIENIFKKID